MARRKFKLKVKWKNLLAAALGLLLIAGAVAGIASITGRDTRPLNALSFSVGALDDSGAFKEYDQSVVSDYFECQGLTIDPDATANGTFEVFYYDENKVFLGTSGVKMPVDGIYTKPSDHSDSYVFLLAKYARVMITPEAPISEDYEEESFRIRFWEASKYASMLTITVDKKQVFERAEENRLFDASDAIEGYSWREGNNVEDGMIVAEGFCALPLVEIPKGTKVVEFWYKRSGTNEGIYVSGVDANGDLADVVAIMADGVEVGVYYHRVLDVTVHNYKSLAITFGGDPEFFGIAFKK